jgi:hypothetical protein
MEIRNNSNLNEKGLYSIKEYRKDDTVLVLSGEMLDSPTRETIRIGDNKHVYDNFGIYMNHSFEPTTKIEGNKVIALRDLNVGDEINFNYNDSEINMASPFYCGEQYVCGK